MKTKPLRILVLAHVALVPPERATARELEDAEWRAEYEVIRTLKSLGHEVRVVGLYDDLTVIEPQLAEYKPHIAFNLMEEFDGIGFFDQNIVSYLELIRLRYTGCNPRGMILARDKALAKKILVYHGIPTPEFEVYPLGKGAPPKIPATLEFPLMVKTLNEEASLGISRQSVVNDETELQNRIQFIHRKFRTDALVERYIDGREFYVGVLGNGKPEVLPIWELRFDHLPDRFPKIATRRAKWDRAYRARNGIRSNLARGLPPETAQKLRQIAKQAYQGLGLSGYARLDLRLDSNGEIYLLEANPNPHIGGNEDFARAARESGLVYGELLNRILNLGMRWQSCG